MLSLPVLLALSLGAPAVQEELPGEELERFEQTLDELAFGLDIPGMSAALVHRREIAWSRGIGYADIEAEVLATPATRYRIASCSKPFAAVLVMQLVEQGKLALDAPMKDFRIPAWFAPDPARYREQPILLRHVLSHTSEGVPGSAYSYSGNIYGDVTWVLEQVTKESYSLLLQERIFDPLEMERTVPGHLRPGEAEWIELARPYDHDGLVNVRTTFQLIDPDPDLDAAGFGPVIRMPAEAVAARRELLEASFTHWNGATSASGIVSTVEDLARFDIALDENRLISAESKARMFTPAVSNAGQVLPYALGWFVEEIQGTKVIWHYGWLPPSVSALYVKVPEKELTFLLLANCDRLSANLPWTASGVRASPFARAFLDALVLD